MRKLRTLLVALATASPLPASVAFADDAPAPPPAPPAPAVPPTAAAQPAPPAPPQGEPPPRHEHGGMHIELTTLKLMLAKGLISQAEYDSAVADMKESAGMHAGDKGTFVMGKWATSLYGFVEADHIYDSTQSFNEVAGNGQVQRPTPAPLPGTGTRYAGEHGRLQFGLRNSRFGIRLKAPETAGGVRTSAQLELDLLGQAAGNGQPGAAGNVSEGSFYTNPALRLRHAFLKVETPIVDVLVGQYWHLFGWQSVYHPNTVEIQGVPGQLYGRTPQIRVSKTFKSGDLQFEIAAAAMRPPQRDSEMPELQGGLRFAHNGWNGMTTNGATGTSLMPISIAVTGDFRRYNVSEYSLAPTHAVSTTSGAFAIDAFIPVLNATKDKKDNALSINGEFVTGAGMADLYTGFNTGLGNFTLPGNAQPTTNVDGNLVVFGPSDGALHPIQIQTYLVGIQYYLPGLDGRYWVSANYAHIQTPNTKDFVRQNVLPVPTTTNQTYSGLVRDSEDWFDVNLFGDVTPGVRIGLEYANFNDKYADGVHAINHRVQASGFFLF